MLNRIQSALVLLFLLPLSGFQRQTFYAQNFNTGLNACLISGWPMNEGSGFVFHDVSGNGNTANSGGGFTWQSNAGFPGTTPLWTTPGGTCGNCSTNIALTNFNGSVPFSASVWINENTGAETTMLSTTANFLNYQGWEFEKRSGQNVVLFWIANTYTGNTIQIHGTANINNGARHYVVVTYDGSQTAAGMKIYVDGVADTTTTDFNSLSASAASGRALDIAQRTDGAEGFAGVLAFAEVYNCVLSPSTIASYNSRGPGIY
jgi:hypothetical protein